MKSALLKLVRYYQRPEEWTALIHLFSPHAHDDPVAFGYRWLRTTSGY